MQRLFVALFAILVMAGTGNAAILGIGASGAAVSQTTLAACAVAANVKQCVVTSPLSAAYSNVSSATLPGGRWPTDRGLEVKTGGEINNTTAFTVNGALTMSGGKFGATGTGAVTINGPFTAGETQVFAGSGRVMFGVGSTAEVRPEWWGITKGNTGNAAIKTANTAAINNAIISTGYNTLQYFNAIFDHTTTNVTRATVKLMAGVYCVNDSLPLASGNVISGAGLGTIIVFSPTSSKTLFKGDTTRYGYGGEWYGITIQNMSLRGDNLTTQYAAIATDFTSVHQFTLRNVNITYFGTAVKTSTGYYDLIDNCHLWHNQLALDVYQNGQPLVVNGGSIFGLNAEYPQGLPTSACNIRGRVAFNGTAIEYNGALAAGAALIKLSGGGAASMNGVYFEGSAGIAAVEIDRTIPFGGSSFSGGYINVSPMLRFTHFNKPEDVTVAGVYPTQYNVPPNFDFGLPEEMDLFTNQNSSNGDATGYGYLNVSLNQLNPTGVLSYRVLSDGANHTSFSRTIAAADVARVMGKTVYFCAWLKKTGTFSGAIPFRLQVQQTGYTTQSKHGTLRAEYVMEDGVIWELWVANYDVRDASAVITISNSYTTTDATASISLAYLRAYVNGYPMIPTHDRNYIARATAFPTLGIFRVGERVVNSTPAVGQPKAWLCTTAGAAYVGARGNSQYQGATPAYRYFSDNTVWQSNPGTTTGASEPAIAGLPVGSAVVDGSTTWIKVSETKAVFTSEGNL